MESVDLFVTWWSYTDTVLDGITTAANRDRFENLEKLEQFRALVIDHKTQWENARNIYGDYKRDVCFLFLL